MPKMRYVIEQKLQKRAIIFTVTLLFFSSSICMRRVLRLKRPKSIKAKMRKNYVLCLHKLYTARDSSLTSKTTSQIRRLMHFRFQSLTIV